MEELQLFAAISPTIQTAAIAVLVFAICAYFPQLNYKAKLAKLPAIGDDIASEKRRLLYLAGAKKDYSNGYKRFKDSVYRMVTGDGEDNIVVPLSLLPEFRKLPDDVLSFPKAVQKSLEVKYTKLPVDAMLVVHSVKSDLTPALVRMNPTICAEVDAAIREDMPFCKDWTEVNINKELINVIAKVSGRVFVGPDLCKDPEYLDSGINFTLDVMTAINAIKRVRPWLRPFLASRLPEVRQLREREQRAAEYLQPIVRGRMESEKNDPNWQPPDDMMQWMLKRSGGVVSVAELAKLQLGLIFAAIHTTSMTATNVLYSLAATPEYIVPLREEILAVMADNDGVLTSRALQQLEKLDSYMKEVMRMFPPSVTSFSRRVMKGITLSNGQYLPPGVIVEVPARDISTDPSYYPDGDTFDGFRHVKLRRNGASTDHARNQFVTTNDTNLVFGYGRHACPGRFFAANELKMILVRLILEYDIKMPDNSTTRHAQLEMGRTTVPNPMKTVMFKKVEV